MTIAEEINARCPVVRSLDVVGDRWTLLILRDAIRGWTRFADFRARLGVAPDVLTDRLGKLVEHGLLEKRPYREPGQRQRDEYVATEEALTLLPVYASIAEWADEQRPSDYGPSIVYAEMATGAPVRLAFVTADGRIVPDAEVISVPGPGSLIASGGTAS
jgi:DNA-binding HxlR family transcriptional regulator